MSRTSAKAPIVRKTVQVNAPPERVYAAFAEPDALSEWYMDGARVDFREGGHLAFEGPDGEVVGEIVLLEEARRVAVAYEAPWWGTVTFALKPTPKGTRVTLTHEGFEGREEWLERYAWAWDSWLKALKAWSEGRPVK